MNMKKMMKTLGAAIAVSAIMCGCGAEVATEPVQEPVSEEVSRDEAPEPETAKESDEAAAESGDTAVTYKEAYLGLAKSWEEEHASDYIHGYKLFDLNDDDVPEIALIGGEEWTCCEIYTFEDGEVKKVCEAQDLGYDGNGLYYYEKSGFTVSVKWMGGIGEYVFYDVMSDEPDKAYCTVTIHTDSGVSTENSTDVEFIEPGGDTVSNHYDEAYDIDTHPDKENVEASLGINDLSDYHRIDNEDDLMSYEEVQNALK